MLQLYRAEQTILILFVLTLRRASLITRESRMPPIVIREQIIMRNVTIQLAIGLWLARWMLREKSLAYNLGSAVFVWLKQAMQRSGTQSDRMGVGGGSSSFIAKSSASEHSMSTGVSASSSGGTLPRTLSTSVLRIKNRSTFWEKFWDERTKRDAWVLQ